LPFAADESHKAAGEASKDDGMAGVLDWLQKGTSEQRKLAGIACRALITYSLSRDSEPKQLDKVILDYRNRALADRILADTHQQIFMTYGAEHLKGLLPLLQASDPKWQIVSVKWLRSIAAPDELEGKL
jgi:hypothetical protein